MGHTALFLAAAGAALLAAPPLGHATTAPLDVHGFVTQGYLHSSKNNYLEKTVRGSFAYTEVGLNFSKNLTDDLRFGMQIFSRHLGIDDGKTLRLDWGFLEYRFRDWLGTRVGRCKTVVGLYNEAIDIDAVHLAAILPSSLYDPAFRNVLLSHTGVDLFGNVRLAGLGAADYALFLGTIPAPNLGAITGVDVRSVAGAHLAWSPPVPNLRLVSSVLRYSASFAIDTSQIAQETLNLSQIGVTTKNLTRWSGGVEYTDDTWLLAAEYARWRGTLASAAQFFLLQNGLPEDVNMEQGYVMVGVRPLDWLQTGGYYSVMFADANDRDGDRQLFRRNGFQKDAALTVRFDINDYWLIKLEGHYIDGTAGISGFFSNTEVNPDPAAVARHWTLFVAKTTISF